MMESDELFYLNKKKQHLEGWLCQYKTTKDVVSYVQANLDMTNWEINAIIDRPTLAGQSPFHDLLESLERDYKSTVHAFPHMPKYDPISFGTATSMATSGTSLVYKHVAEYADSGIPEAIDFSNKYTQQYRDIQTQQNRPKQVRNLMQQFCTDSTLQRFDKAIGAYQRTKSGATSRENTALALRNTMNGIKGDLFKAARTKPKEDMTWPKMSQLLARGDEEATQLVKQQEVGSTLYSNLSEILKLHDRGASTNLDNLWTQILDYIYAVLSLLKPSGKQ